VAGGFPLRAGSEIAIRPDAIRTFQEDAVLAVIGGFRGQSAVFGAPSEDENYVYAIALQIET
jgi:hypothetical protein